MSTWYVPKPVTQRDPSDPQAFSQPTTWPGAVSAAPAVVHSFEGGTNVAKRTCSVDGCERPYESRGYCVGHLRRVDSHGHAFDDVPLYMGNKLGGPTLEARFWSKVEWSEGCWKWLPTPKREGYGQFWHSPAVGMVYAHRLAYELAVGPIPDGLVIDHLCRNRRCVNPAHLEPVEFAENVRRGVGVERMQQAKAARMAARPAA